MKLTKNNIKTQRKGSYDCALVAIQNTLLQFDQAIPSIKDLKKQTNFIPKIGNNIYDIHKFFNEHSAGFHIEILLFRSIVELKKLLKQDKSIIIRMYRKSGGHFVNLIKIDSEYAYLTNYYPTYDHYYPIYKINLKKFKALYNWIISIGIDKP